jgi:hypothetical protein
MLTSIKIAGGNAAGFSGGTHARYLTEGDFAGHGWPPGCGPRTARRAAAQEVWLYPWVPYLVIGVVDLAILHARWTILPIECSHVLPCAGMRRWSPTRTHLMRSDRGRCPAPGLELHRRQKEQMPHLQR